MRKPYPHASYSPAKNEGRSKNKLNGHQDKSKENHILHKSWQLLALGQGSLSQKMKWIPITYLFLCWREELLLPVLCGALKQYM